MGMKPGGDPGEPLRPALRELDVASGDVRDVCTWTTPAAHHPGEDQHLEFTAGWRQGPWMWQPTRTEVLKIRWQTGEVVEVIDHPLFADLHSVMPHPDGGLVVTATGHDSVLHLVNGQVRAHWWLRGSAQEFQKQRKYPDYRLIPFGELKPHLYHPNHTVVLDGDLWVTCFEDRCARCLTARHPDIALPEGPPHDGRIREGIVWFTTVNGWVIGVDPATRERVVEIDVHALDPRPGLPGWCRGVEVVGDTLFVGMTTLRSSRHRDWLRRAIRGRSGESRPTRVVQLDWRRQRWQAEFDVGNAAGGTLYSIAAV